MTSKPEKLAFFNWQKSSDEWIFSVALLVGLFAVRNDFSGDYKLAVYLILGLLIFLSGWGLIRSYSLEIEYLNFLKDGRYKESKWDAIKRWGLYIVYIILACIIVYLAMDIWKTTFLSSFIK